MTSKTVRRALHKMGTAMMAEDEAKYRLEVMRRERDEARAEVERLRAALEKVMLCSHSPTGKACNCFRQGEAALRRSTTLVTEGDK